MSYRVAVQFAVDGDLRFLSHQDGMKLFERAAVRAALPLRWGQGFNPHPRLSLPLPRPVGLASADELLVLELDDSPPAASRAVLGTGPDTPMPAMAEEAKMPEDEAGSGCPAAEHMAAQEVLDRLAPQMPAGIRLLSAYVVPAPPQPESARYSVRFGEAGPDAQAGLGASPAPADLPARIDGLLAATATVLRRRVDDQGTDRSVDIRPYIENVQWDPQTGRLEWTLRVTATGSARPGEVLAALGLDPAKWLHRVTREQVIWQKGMPKRA